MSTSKKRIRKGQEKRLSTPPFLEEIMVTLTGVGDLIDVRFKVDAKMKLPGPVYVQDEGTGKIGRVATVPKIGQILSRKQAVGNYAYGIFLNPDDVVKTGSLVTFVSGGYRKEHIKVY
jgi:hypothetical protein